MKTKLHFSFGLVTLLLTAGCSLPKPEKINLDDAKLDMNPTLDELFTCNRKEEEVPADNIEPQDSFIVQDSIESQDTVLVDCDGTQKPLGIVPLRSLAKDLIIEPPPGLNEKVSSIHVENLRTCSLQKIITGDDKSLEDQVISIPGQDPFVLHPLEGTRGSHSGQLRLSLTDSSIKWTSFRELPVRDHRNVVKISYFGECLKYQETSEDSKNPSAKCLEAELLLERKIMISVQVNRPLIPGTKYSKTCPKK